MTCLTAQSLILKYINNELSGTQLEAFLNHIDNCNDCRDELQIYYIMFRGIKQLDDDTVSDYDFHRQFEESLDFSRRKIVRLSIARKAKILILELLIVVFPLFLDYSYARERYTKGIVYTQKKESSYQINNYFNVNNNLDKYIKENRNKIERYLRKRGTSIRYNAGDQGPAIISRD